MEYNDIQNKIMRRMTSIKWLQKNNISRDMMDSFLKSSNFTFSVKAMLEEKDFSCSRVLLICKDLMENLNQGNNPSDWLSYIYQYSLNNIFKEAVTIELDPALEVPCEIYLGFLRIFSDIEKNVDGPTWQSKYPLNFLNENEINKLEFPEEYRKFIKAFNFSYAYEMMKLSKEVMNYNTLDHICGVHSLSLTIGKQLNKLGIPVDLGRVSGAAGGHDIGKYGCKGSELKRVPRLHYYYTDQWFKRFGINYIRNIAINHSTWDLELENLSIESLLLIYSDFRVKNDVNTGEMKIYSLEESFFVILEKLENVDEEKTKRYKKVYAKLKDFEDYIISLGVNPEPDKVSFKRPIPKQYALLQGNEIIQNIKYTAINHNISLMYQLRDEYSLEKILEAARSEKDWRNLREYIRIFEEYSTYLTQKQKIQTLNFLYDNLVHSEDDIRRHCAELMGTLIAIFDEEYRKEIPEKESPDLSSINSSDLFRDYLELLTMPSPKLIPSHKFNIRYSLSILVNSLFSKCSINSIESYMNILIEYYKDTTSKVHELHIFLLETASYIPIRKEYKDIAVVFEYLVSMISKRNITTRIQALETTLKIVKKLKSAGYPIEFFRNYFETYNFKTKYIIENILLLKITTELNLNEQLTHYKNICEISKKNSTEIFLSNLKTETDWIRKRNQVDLLLDYSMKNPSRRGLHAAIHFCNLLKVSEVECVRSRAGTSILELMPVLSIDERNEVAIELLRALEIEGNRFTEYIPYYAGQVYLWLQPKELDEAIEDSINRIKISKPNLKALILKTIGIAVSNYNLYKDRFNEPEEDYNKRLGKMLGILLNGLGNYDSRVKQAAFSVIGKDIFGTGLLDIKDKLNIFKLISKKMLTLITDNKTEELLFLAKSAGFNHIYRFISDYMLQHGEIEIPIPKKVAFFPGTFDPFSISHKEIALSIKDLGFEVYLAVDGFSWSKKTLPSLLRRYIINMSMSDVLDIYIYPDIYPTNLSNPNDLRVLKENFTESEVYIAVGSDVVLNASSYKNERVPYSIHNFSHIVFERGKNRKLKSLLNNIILGNTIVLSLSSRFKEISSTQIRSNIDENKDISTLVDPMAQQYIYDNGFYQREAQDKSLIKPLDIMTLIIDKTKEAEINDLYYYFNDNKDLLNILKETLDKPFGRILLIKNTSNGNIMGFSIFHRIRSTNIFNEINDADVVSYIRQNRVGRLVLINGFKVLSYDRNLDIEQLLITETLAYCVARDFEYAVYNDILGGCFDFPDTTNIYETLNLHGFNNIPGIHNPIFVTDMSNPCVMNLDMENLIKEPFRSNSRVKQSILNARKRLQKSIVDLYPGKLLLSFDINYMNQNIIRKICKENNVETYTTVPRKLGELMCVPYGDLLDRFIIPNTVTKALHTEKVFAPDMKSFKINEFPHYLDLNNQVKVINSFNKPVILVDNILHKGYRIKALDPIFKEEGIDVKKIICGIMSGRGKDLMDIQGREVDSAYFIPKLNLWFNETSQYPFIGGDALWRGSYMERNLLPSINLIMPYTSPVFIRNTNKSKIFNFSRVCIENSLEILTTLEEEFHYINEKNLNLSSLGQVFTVPRCPDHGNNIEYDLNLNASHYLKNDLELLLRFEPLIKED
ncbi:MAG: cytidyltransferase [Solirubrobacterales bacterium]